MKIKFPTDRQVDKQYRKIYCAKDTNYFFDDFVKWYKRKIKKLNKKRLSISSEGTIIVCERDLPGLYKFQFQNLKYFPEEEEDLGVSEK